jgi:hypothetical protein
MIDEGSSINVMPLSTMNKLGLSITEPSFSVIHVADHRTCKPSGRIRNLNVNTGGENYKLTFEVLPIKGGPGDFPLLLGRSFLRKSGGVANWSAKKPSFTYGPPTNRTIVLIKPRAFFYDKVIKPIMPTSESLPRNTEFAEKNPLFSKADLQETIQCIGPGLHDFKDDGTLSQWLADNPYSDDEATVEVTNCITVLESSPVQDLSSSQMEAEQEQVNVTSDSTPTQEGHFNNGAAQRIWICNSEEDVPNQRGEILVAISKTSYLYSPVDDTIIFRPWLNYLEEKDREASKWMKEEVEGAGADEVDGGSPRRLSNNWETSCSYNEGSPGRSPPEGGLCKVKHQQALCRPEQDTAALSPEVTKESIHFLDTVEVPLEGDLLDPIWVGESSQDNQIFHLEVDGTQQEDWEALMEERVVIDDLVPPLNFCKTSSGILAGHDVPKYPSVPNDWYHGPTHPTHVPHTDWKEMDIALSHEEPKLSKVGVDLSQEKMEDYKQLLQEFGDVIAWKYSDLKGIPHHITQHTIQLKLGAKPIRQKQRRMNPRMQLMVKAELERRRKVAFDKRQKIRNLLPDMWVMLQDARKLEFPAKFDALWTGPYIIKEVFPNNSV